MVKHRGSCDLSGVSPGRRILRYCNPVDARRLTSRRGDERPHCDKQRHLRSFL
jgi:hypothetical protein